MIKKRTQILELSDKEEVEKKDEEKDASNNKEDDTKVNRTKDELQNIGGHHAE